MRLDKAITPLDNLIYSHYRIAHALRISVAFVLTFLILRLLTFPEATWALITLVVVMGPLSYWGNVFSRAIQRIGGTLFGAASGLVALYIQQHSFSAMLVWCFIVMFICGYLTLGNRPYMALLIGVTLALVCGSASVDMNTALWRSTDVIIGSVLALFFTSIYPQRAFTHWRMQLSDSLHAASMLYAAYLSPNIMDRPRLDDKMKVELARLVKMRTYIGSATKESGIDKEVFNAIQTLYRNLVCTLEMLADTYWATRESHFLLLNVQTLRHTQLLTIRTLDSLSHCLRSGQPEFERSVASELSEISVELQNLIDNAAKNQQMEAPIYGYVWLSMEMTRQLKELGDLIHMTMRR
ncbi:FUSC family protein [Yersinia ruckeri]|uniref:Inner membrane protein n=1 Tax=Yersinia ruckeri TaxID=29486 RepID=A0A0A8VKF4_YERRU|nr:FUSC family protein [Yersinia ruckeri]AKA37647.1 membrane protein [Yersinia ruckeri]EEP98714.1 Inner membrane protein yeeA [Yersinia ruckeri ATCC 29473]EKN3346785.1 FUSC family protein [Yersinia ruckeri]EKN3362046.1 FUSC family protein [Yersinia ruckeri]EKN4181855.1 FUSC family protein [Yersinia ruckeri]